MVKKANILMTYLGPNMEEDLEDQDFEAMMKRTDSFEDFKAYFTEVIIKLLHVLYQINNCLE